MAEQYRDLLLYQKCLQHLTKIGVKVQTSEKDSVHSVQVASEEEDTITMAVFFRNGPICYVDMSKTLWETFGAAETELRLFDVSEQYRPVSYHYHCKEVSVGESLLRKL